MHAPERRQTTSNRGDGLLGRVLVLGEVGDLCLRRLDTRLIAEPLLERQSPPQVVGRLSVVAQLLGQPTEQGENLGGAGIGIDRLSQSQTLLVMLEGFLGVFLRLRQTTQRTVGVSHAGPIADRFESGESFLVTNLGRSQIARLLRLEPGLEPIRFVRGHINRGRGPLALRGRDGVENGWEQDLDQQRNAGGSTS